MTNLEWIRTLSEEEFADWLYDEWLHHLQYRWSSSRGGLIIWLKDRKTENSSEKPNNCEHITEDGVTCAKYPACDDCLDNPLNKVKGSERLVKGSEQTDCQTCKWWSSYGYCVHRECKGYEPQTDWHYDEQDATWYPYKHEDEPQTCSVSGRPYIECADCEHFRCTADEPQTERSE